MKERQARKKFSSQIDSTLLADLRALSKAEGRSLQSLIEEAFGKLIKSRQTHESDFEMLMKRNHDRYDSVFEKFSK